MDSDDEINVETGWVPVYIVTTSTYRPGVDMPDLYRTLEAAKKRAVQILWKFARGRKNGDNVEWQPHTMSTYSHRILDVTSSASSSLKQKLRKIGYKKYDNVFEGDTDDKPGEIEYRWTACVSGTGTPTVQVDRGIVQFREDDVRVRTYFNVWMCEHSLRVNRTGEDDCDSN